MAQQIQAPVKTRDPDRARTVVAAKPVELALITYVDEYGMQQTQFGVVGDNTVHLLDSRSVGLAREASPSGRASEWIRDGVFKLLKRKKS